MRTAGCAVLLLAQIGCSFVFTTRAPPKEEWPTSVARDGSRPGCTDAYWLPAVDTALAVAIVAGAYHETHAPDSDIPGAWVLIIPVVSPLIASAIYGIHAVDRCHAYQQFNP